MGGGQDFRQADLGLLPRDQQLTTQSIAAASRETLVLIPTTLTKVNSIIFGAGDTIRFRRGGLWTGRLQPQGTGST
jgi:hypothetical protein